MAVQYWTGTSYCTRGDVRLALRTIAKAKKVNGFGLVRPRSEADSDTILLTHVAVAAAAHAAGDTVRGEPALVVLARVGAALVRMVEQARLRTPPLHGHLECADGEVATVDGADRPADHAAREQVGDRRDEEFGPRPDDKLRGIADPVLIRPVGRTLELIEHEANGLLFKLFRELSSGASGGCVGRHGGHRIRLWQSVHEIDYEVTDLVQHVAAVTIRRS